MRRFNDKSRRRFLKASSMLGLGTAPTLFRRGSRGLPVPAIQDGELGSLI